MHPRQVCCVGVTFITSRCPIGPFNLMTSSPFLMFEVEPPLKSAELASSIRNSAGTPSTIQPLQPGPFQAVVPSWML
jgi:flavin reductase (DIM6/NTAB) family NADH-FMN oxidoreductase RutF